MPVGAMCSFMCACSGSQKLSYAAWLAYVRVANPGRPGLASAMQGLLLPGGRERHCYSLFVSGLVVAFITGAHR